MRVVPAHTPWRSVRLFARAPKGIMLWVLLALAALALPVAGLQALPGVLVAVACALLADVVVAGIDQGRPVLPTSSILTGLFVALVLAPAEPVSVVVAATLVAVASKHVLRGARWHIFNPAALGLLVVALLFGSEESWWGSLPDLPAAAVLVLLAAGILVVGKVNKWPLALAFLGAFYALFTAASFFDPAPVVVEAFRSPYTNTALFFAFFMLTDPPTSPIRYRDQVAYGVLVAALSVAIQVAFHPQYYLLAGLLIGNAAFAWWRAQPARRTASAARNTMAAAR